MNIDVANIGLVALVALVPLVVGTLWYSRFMFGSLWMRYVQIDETTTVVPKGAMLRKSIISYVSYFLIAYALGVLVQYLIIATLVPALILALVVSLGFVVPALASDFIWAPTAKSWGLYYIHAGFFMVSIALMSVILALWM